MHDECEPPAQDSEVGWLSRSLNMKSMKGTKEMKDTEGIEAFVYRSSMAND